MIKFSHVMKKYDNITPIKDIDAEIKNGEVVSIIGPSGTGKSTLLRMVNGLEKPTSGKVFVDDIEVNEKNASAITKKVGMVFQNYNLFNHLTVIDNLMIAQVEILKRDKQTAYDKSIELLKAVHLQDKIDAYPNELSGGERQRIAIARTLAMDPEILLLDEPTAALDPKLVGEIKDLILDYAKTDKIVLIVAHSMKLAHDICNRVFFLDEGIIYEDGTPDEVFNNPQKPKTKEFINSQKTLEFKIDKHFSFINVSNQFTNFCTKHNVAPRLTKNVILIFEEVISQMLLTKYENPDIKVKLEYKNENIDMLIVYKGNKYNIMDSKKPVSLKIVEGLSSKIDYAFDENAEYQNRLEIQING